MVLLVSGQVAVVVKLWAQKVGGDTESWIPPCVSTNGSMERGHQRI